MSTLTVAEATEFDADAAKRAEVVEIKGTGIATVDGVYLINEANSNPNLSYSKNHDGNTKLYGVRYSFEEFWFQFCSRIT